MPFKLAFDVEIIILIEIDLPSCKVESFNEQENSNCLCPKLDLFEEIREQAWIRITSYQQRMAHYYNSKVMLKIFNYGNLVLYQAKVSKPIKQDRLASN